MILPKDHLIAHLKLLDKQMTPGNWRVMGDERDRKYAWGIATTKEIPNQGKPESEVFTIGCSCCDPTELNWEDGAGIAYLRNIIPDLIETLEDV